MRTFLMILFMVISIASYTQGPILVLPIGHSGAITKIQISSDKRFMLTRSTDNTVKLWNFQTGSLMYTIDNPNIHNISFSKDGSFFLTYGYEHNDEPITIWDTKKIKPVDTIKVSSVKYAHFTPDNNVIALSYEGLIKQEIVSQKKIILIGNDGIGISRLAFADDASMYCYDYSGNIVLRNAITNEIMGQMPLSYAGGDGTYLHYFILSSKNNYMLLEYENGNKTHYEIYNINTNKIQSKFEGYFTGEASEEAIKFSPDEKYLYSTEYFKNRLHVWDIVTGKELPPIVMKEYTYEENSDADFKNDNEFKNVDSTTGIDEYLISPDSKYVLADASYTNVIDQKTKKRLVRTEGLPSANQMLFLNDTTILMLDDYSKNSLRAFTFPYFKPTQIVFEGKTEEIEKQFYDTVTDIITVVTDNYIQFWNPQTQLNIFKKCSFIHINAEHNKVLAKINKRNLCVIDNKTGNELYQVDLGRAAAPDIAQFSPSGKYIVTNSNPIYIIDAQTGKLINKIPLNNLGNSVVFQISKDDKYIAIPTRDDGKASTTIYNIQTGEQISKPIGNVYFSFVNDSSQYFLWSMYGSSHVLTGVENVLALVDFKKNKIQYQKTGAFSYITNYNNHYLIVTSYDSAKSYAGMYNSRQYPVKTEIIDLLQCKKLNETEQNSVPFIYCGSSEKLFFTYYNALSSDSNYYKIKIWDIRTGNFTRSINVDYSPLNSTLYSDKKDKYLVCCTDDNVINIYNLATSKLIRKIAIAEEIKNIEFAANSAQLIVSLGGMTELVDFDPNLSPEANNSLNRIVFSKVGEGQFTQVNNQYYSMDKALLKDINFRYNNNTISANQLDVKYNRPDKVLEALGNTDTALISAYRQAYYKRIKKLGIDTTQFKEGYSIPEADFVNRDSIRYEQTKKYLRLKIHAVDSNYVLDRFNIWINESPIYGQRGISIKRRNKRTFDTTITVQLSQGDNRIETSVTNANVTESYHIPLSVKYIPSQQDSVTEKLHFIGIGTNHFANSQYDLQWSVKDIQGLADSLKNKYGNNIEIDTLFDEKVNAKAVKNLKSKLLRTNVNDKVIVAFSGHGLLSKDYDYYLSTYKVDFNKPEENGLPYDELENLLDSIPARKKLLLIDACNSGEVDKDEMQHYARVEKTLDSTGVHRGAELTNTDSSKVGMKNSFELMQQLFTNVGKSTGATIISAAAGTQFALERNNLQHGVFTYSILEYMRQHAHASVNELKDYVNTRVPQLTQGLQQPTTRNESKDIDWNVW